MRLDNIWNWKDNKGKILTWKNCEIPFFHKKQTGWLKCTSRCFSLELLITTTQLLLIEVGKEKSERMNTSLKILRLIPKEISLFFSFGFFFSSFLREGGNNSKCSLGITKISQKWGKLIAVLCVLHEVRIVSFREKNHFSPASILHLTIREKKENTKIRAALRWKSDCLNSHPHLGGVSFHVSQRLIPAKDHVLCQMIRLLKVRTASLEFSTIPCILVRWINRILRPESKVQLWGPSKSGLPRPNFAQQLGELKQNRKTTLEPLWKDSHSKRHGIVPSP